MNKKIFKRGIALAMLLVFTVSAFIIPTSATEVTRTVEVAKVNTYYYTPINEVMTEYGDASLLSFTFVVDWEEFATDGGAIRVRALVDGADRDICDISVNESLVGKTYSYSEFSDLIGSQYSGDIPYLDVPLKLSGVTSVSNVRLYVTYTVEIMSEGLIQTMFGGFGETINGLTNGIKSMFVNILYVDGTSASGLSHFAKFGFLMGGLTMALGLGYVIINKLR